MVNCFFCKCPMVMHNDPSYKVLRCECGESIFVDYRISKEGYPGFGPTCFLPPALKYWTEEIAIEWEEFKSWQINAYCVLGHYSEEQASGHLVNLRAELSKWRQQQKNRGLRGLIRRLFKTG